MIAQLNGRILAIRPDHLVLDVGNVGYLVHCSERTLAALGETGETVLYTHYMIRQDEPTLYGFLSEEEKAIFLLLLTVPRIGPRVALNLLACFELAALSAAIASEDALSLTIAAGVSLKLAQKIVVELRDRFPAGEITSLRNSVALDAEVVDALVALGYGVVEAQRTVQSIPQDAPEDVGERLRIALGRMGSE
ncbi:MAG: Holliday junction branch migration protein RuvA [Chloroflexi bacterium]|nr:Holliday junction branch migration protein RuvA [Anaerolineaceae bacterium]MCY4105416.1 Holliday junction branch migration protein RuvA [Chloroflexota bacterium]